MMNWYQLTKLAFGAPLANNQPLMEDSKDIFEKALEGKPGLGQVVSPFDASKPGHKAPKPSKKTRRKRHTVKRRPGPDLFEGPKFPTDTAGGRPSGALTD